MQVLGDRREGLAILAKSSGEDLAAQGSGASPDHNIIGLIIGAQTVPQRPKCEIAWLNGPNEAQVPQIAVAGLDGNAPAETAPDLFRPHVVLVNATGKLTAAEGLAWGSILLSAKYHCVWFDELSRYYVAEEHLTALRRYFPCPASMNDVVPCAGKDIPLPAEDGGACSAIARIAESEARSVRAERRAAQERAARMSVERRARVAEIVGLAAQAEIATLRASTSWRFTAPLRRLSWALHRRGRPDETADPASSLDQSPARRRTLYIECTHTYFSDVNTGIQRVVRNVLRYAADIGDRYGFDVVPVIVHAGRFVVADVGVVLADKQRQRLERVQQDTAVQDQEQAAPPRVKLRRRMIRLCRSAWRACLWTLAKLLPFKPVNKFLYAPPDSFGLARCILFPWRFAWTGFRLERPVSPPVSPDLDKRPLSSADVLLLLDSSWHLPVWPSVQRFKAHGGTVVCVVYDMIPISHPDACVPELVSSFDQWFKHVASEADAIVAISNSTATALKRYLGDENGRGHPLPPVAHFHLGSELDFHVDEHDVRSTIETMFDTDDHVYLMVGSIEPRKKHAFVLEAFDRHWTAGGEGRLVIIGRQAWRTDDVLQRIASHHEYERRLYLVRDASDSELDHAYRNASALIIASEIEGFGLPVVEAFQRGLPVLCSDIPVFREIADGRATFFSLDAPDRLAAVIRGFTQAHDPARRRERQPVAWLTWRESTEQLFAAMAPFLGCVPQSEDDEDRVPESSAVG